MELLKESDTDYQLVDVFNKKKYFAKSYKDFLKSGISRIFSFS